MGSKLGLIMFGIVLGMVLAFMGYIVGTLMGLAWMLSALVQGFAG